MSERLNATPTIEEFRAAITSLSTNSAAGPTGLTYNMM